MTDTPVLVLVTGSGRSGTSSLAGSLKRLGLHVPQPEVPPGATNERGFYEPEWVIRFHKARLKELGLHNIDSRPWAVDMVAELTADGSTRAELEAWLVGQRDLAPLVVKDPHALWFADVWREAAAGAGLDLRLLTAIRHPAEVIGSRDLAYLQHQSEQLRLVKETSNLAGWLHAALLTERAGRGHRRAFIRYDDLIGDWRSALDAVDRQLALGLGEQIARRPHEIDDFLDSDLRRAVLTWDDLRAPAPLLRLAERAWEALQALVADPHLSEAQATLDTTYDDYARLYGEAVAIAYDHTHGEVETATRRKQGQIHKLRHELKAARSHQDRPAPPTGLLARLRRR